MTLGSPVLPSFGNLQQLSGSPEVQTPIKMLIFLQ